MNRVREKAHESHALFVIEVEEEKELVKLKERLEELKEQQDELEGQRVEQVHEFTKAANMQPQEFTF